MDWRSLKGTRKDAAGAVKLANHQAAVVLSCGVEREQGSRSSLAGKARYSLAGSARDDLHGPSYTRPFQHLSLDAPPIIIRC